MHMIHELTYKSVQDIMKNQFIIPKYQRGYRWGRKQVEQLIDDIYENKQGDYHLQPLVINKVIGSQNKWNVIDGQQRLTTIFILVGVFNYLGSGNMDKASDILSQAMSLQYESRDSSEVFLRFLINGENLSDLPIYNVNQQHIWNRFLIHEGNVAIKKNIDFEYMLNTFCISVNKIMKLIENNNVELLAELKQRLLGNCKFLWYQITIEKGDDSRRIETEYFTKINIGKIELTDAELIKAEIMNPNRLSRKEKGNRIREKQFAISETWYFIENELHKPDFWAFVPHENQYTFKNHSRTRIDVLFEFLLLEQERKKGNEINAYLSTLFPPYEHSLFLRLERHLNSGQTADQTWWEIRDIYENLKELYESDGRTQIEDDKSKSAKGKGASIYNLLSFITLYRQQKEKKDTSVYLEIYNDFYNFLNEDRNKRLPLIKTRIKELVFGEEAIDHKIKSMKYVEGGRDELREILLLYNLILLSKSTGIGNRYNFIEHHNSKRKWTREHIFPQSFKFPKDRALNTQRKILELITHYLDKQNNAIVLKKEMSLRYLNYLNNKEDYCWEKNRDLKRNHVTPPFPVTNSGVINWKDDEKAINAFLLFKRDKDEYEQAYENIIILIQKAIELLPKVIFLEKCIKLMKPKTEQVMIIKHFESNKDLLIDLSVEKFISIFETDTTEGRNELNRMLETLFEDSDSIQKYTEKCSNGFLVINDERLYEVRIVDGNLIEYEENEQLKGLFAKKYKEVIDDINSIDHSLQIKLLKSAQQSFQEEVSSFFNERFPDLIIDNSLGNMALLDMKVNGSQAVGNNLYNEKKVAIYNEMKSGEFIPLATMLVFSDVYTKSRITDEYWMHESRYEYLHDIIKTISEYLMNIN